MKKNIIMYTLSILAAMVFLIACNTNSNKQREVQLLTDSTTYYNNLASDTAAVLEGTSADSRMTTTQRKSSGTKTTTKKVDQTYTPSTNSASQGTTEKKGWSKAAQGAVIGGATGAVGGAIISKNKGAGAAVGAAVGAAGGYIIGNEQDKKDGRKKKKKDQ